MGDNCSHQKESFVFYRSFANTIDRLPAEIQLPLYKAITAYALDMKAPSFEDCQDKVFLEAIWESIRPQLDANHKRYLNGCKGGAPKGSHNNPNGRRGKTNQELTNIKPNVNDNVNVNGNDNVVISKTTTKKFIKPTIEEIRYYCTSRRNSVDAEKFHDYYEANGWKIGKNSMKDWKAAVRTWEKNAQDSNRPQQPPQRKHQVITNVNDLDL